MLYSVLIDQREKKGEAHVKPRPSVTSAWLLECEGTGWSAFSLRAEVASSFAHSFLHASLKHHPIKGLYTVLNKPGDVLPIGIHL